MVDPYAIVIHCKNEFSGGGIDRAHGDFSTGGCELDRILQQVPKYLIESGSVARHMVFVGCQFEVESQGLGPRITAYNLLRVNKQRMDIDGPGNQELEFTVRDPSQV